jgi:hypothetical protein
MPLSIVKTGVSAGYGALDLATEYLDVRQAYTKPFENITDIQRVIAANGGAVGAYMMKGTYGDVCESLSLSSIPLLEKSIYNAVVTWTGKGVKLGAQPTPQQVHGQLVLKRAGQTNPTEGYRNTLGFRASLG